MARKIVITSGKGGVGKTTICANIGSMLAKFGFRVVLIDGDIGLNNLDVIMGIENRVIYDLNDVMENKCRLKQALIADTNYPNLYILPSSHSNSNSCKSIERLGEIINMLDSSFDYMLIDCPAGVDNGFHRAVSFANEAIIVVTPHISSIRDADKVLAILSSYNMTSKNLVINRVRGDLVLNGEMIEVEEIADFLRIPILGVIPEDDDITTLSTLGAIATNNVSGRAFTLLTENLHNGTRKIYDYTMKYRGLMGKFRRNIKRKV